MVGPCSNPAAVPAGLCRQDYGVQAVRAHRAEMTRLRTGPLVPPGTEPATGTPGPDRVGICRERKPKAPGFTGPPAPERCGGVRFYRRRKDPVASQCLRQACSPPAASPLLRGGSLRARLKLSGGDGSVKIWPEGWESGFLPPAGLDGGI